MPALSGLGTRKQLAYELSRAVQLAIAGDDAGVRYHLSRAEYVLDDVDEIPTAVTAR